MAALNPVHTTERESRNSVAAPAGERDEELLREGRVLIDRACTGDQSDRGQAAVMTDDLLDRARRALRDAAMSPPYYARVLRAAALVRNMAKLPELPPDPLVHELVSHTVRHGLAAHNAAAQALRGTLALARGSVDDALTAVVDAMATLEIAEEHTVDRALAINDTAVLLDQLGLPDQAAELFARCVEEFAAVGMPGYQVMTMGDQVKAELVYGLWLERVGQQVPAAHRFAAAAALARRGLRHWQEADPPLDLDEDFLAELYAALYLAEPSAEHETALRTACRRIAVPGQMIAALALVRLLFADDRPDEAATVLAEVRTASRRFQVAMPLRLAMARAITAAQSGGYVTALEDELWAVRTTRGRALHARLEHERLRRGRAPMSALTATDPVTRLPDRSILDDLLAATDRHTEASQRPSVIAMVDVDDLVQINQRGSYADGDAALRAVAVTVRAAVQPNDAVVRYSDDEIVVLMRDRSVDEAAEVMRQVAITVTKLPYDRARGATVSIGVVSVHAGETAEAALVRADNATAAARERGGDQVAVMPATPAQR